MSKISKFEFLLIPSITEIKLVLKFKTLKYLLRERSIILVIALLLTSKKSKCKGGSLTSNIDTNSLLVAFTLIK